MVQATLDPRWVPKDKCPLVAKIHGVEELKESIKGRPYITLRLTLHGEDGEFYQYDAKFGDKNFLINTFTGDTEKWIGKEIVIILDGETTYKRIALKVA